MLSPGKAVSAEELVRETIASIPALNPDWHERAVLRLNSLTKPLGSLGRLEEMAARLVAIREEEFPDCANKVIFTLAADHGVTEEGVSAYPKTVTRQMVLNFLSGGAAINVLCRQFGIEVVVVDIGVDGDTDELDGLVRMKVRRGTNNMAVGPAMTRAEAWRALQAGIALSERARQASALVIAGPMAMLFVPLRTFIRTRPSSSSVSPSTPMSTTTTSIPNCRQRTLIAAPPERKFRTICRVTALG